jgi:hypothetical protein
MADYTDELAKIKIECPGVSPSLLEQVTPAEVTLGESLLTPGLQTAVRCQSYFHNIPIKDLNQFRNTKININIERPSLARSGIHTTMDVSNTLYRLDKRHLINDQIEEYTLHACHQTLLNDAKSLVSKLWQCSTPSQVTAEVLSGCAGAGPMNIEGAPPARLYMAENIHPFQVVAQQGNAALQGGNNPDFVHFMTYEALGTHHFRSLKTMCSQSHVMDFYYDTTGAAAGGYGNPNGIMTHSFPCDFDLLSDCLNGMNESGSDISTFLGFNPFMRSVAQAGSQAGGCGLGSGNPKTGSSAAGSEGMQNMCPDLSEKYILKRQARMGMLEQDKIALRLVVPWNPILNAGKIIRLNLKNAHDWRLFNFGSGDYLIHSIMHNIKYGGFSTLTIDCVSNTVGLNHTV